MKNNRNEKRYVAQLRAEREEKAWIQQQQQQQPAITWMASPIQGYTVNQQLEYVLKIIVDNVGQNGVSSFAFDRFRHLNTQGDPDALYQKVVYDFDHGIMWILDRHGQQLSSLLPEDLSFLESSLRQNILPQYPTRFYMGKKLIEVSPA